jgi:hypothetical protein
MAAKWTSHRKQEWEGKGTVTCKTSLTLADQALDKAKEQETEETRLKLLESGMGHTGKHSQSSTHWGRGQIRGWAAQINEEILYTKGGVQNMAQMLLSFSNPEVTRRVYAALEEANEAANWSSYKIRRLRKKFELMPTSSEDDSITEADLFG